MKNRSLKVLLKNIAILLFFITLLNLIFNTLFAEKEFITKERIVMRGESLWSIAEELISDTNDLSIDRIIYDIKEINSMNSSIVYEGQTINIPVYSTNSL